MRLLQSACLLVVMLFTSRSVWAHSWNEPWHQSVVKDAATLVKAKVLKVTGSEANFLLLKNVAGLKLPSTFTVTGLSHQHLNVGSGDMVYLFLAQTEEDKGSDDVDIRSKNNTGPVYALITPTASVVPILPDGVVAVYRHSYHAAMVSPELYEWTQQAIFNHSKKEPWNEKHVRKYISSELGQEPADLETHPDSAFFRQHIALELIYHLEGAGLGRKDILALVEPYLNDSGYHLQISAARALGAVSGEDSTERLLGFVEKPNREGFAKVMALWALRSRRTKDVQKRLEVYKAKAETEEIGFGGNIMDPRIGTLFPVSVKSAIDSLLKQWGPLSTAPDTQKIYRPVAKTTEAPMPQSDSVQPASPEVTQKKVGCASCSSAGNSTSLVWPLLLLLCLYRKRSYR